MMPTPIATSAELARRLLQRRAVEAVIWGMPAVNFELLYQAALKAGASWNQVVYWSRRLDWKNQTLTPNADTIYLFTFINTKEVGPVVLEIPAADEGSITGSVDDAWQTAIEDVGPAGVDRGDGGKYLLLPPGHDLKAPQGYIPMPSATHASAAFLRSNISRGTEADVAQAVNYGKRVKVYPLSRAAQPDATTFVDAIDVLYDNTIPYDVRFFETLHRFIQREPWLQRDRVMIDVLASIGLEQGQPFNPDAEMRRLLNEAAAEARAWLDNRFESQFSPSYYATSHWAVPVGADVIEGMSTGFAEPSSYPIDGRGVLYSMAYFSAKHLGAGQFYLMTIHDRDSRPLEGSETYRLTVPAEPPIKLYWSATVYDRTTHTLIRELPWSSRSSLTPGLRAQPDGSVDLHIGPVEPEQGASNWIPTRKGQQFEVMFRFYGPEKPVFDKTWQLPDVVRTSIGRG
jgi:hypothetical protein